MTGDVETVELLDPNRLDFMNISKHENITFSAHVEINTGKMLLMEFFYCGTIEIPTKNIMIVYGHDGDCVVTPFWANGPSDVRWRGYSYYGIAGQRAVSGFVGNTQTKTNISTSLNCWVERNDGTGYIEYIIYYSHLDDTVTPLHTQGTTNDYNTCDLPVMSYQYGRRACSSTLSADPYFLDYDGSDPCIRDGKTGATVTIIDLSAYGYTDIYTNWYYSSSAGIGIAQPIMTNTRDDVDDCIYIIVGNGTVVKVAGIDIAGNLIKVLDFGPLTPYGYTHYYAVESFLSNGYLVSTRYTEDNNGHYTFERYAWFIFPLNL